MIELKVQISDVDYDSLTDILWPLVAGQVAEKSSGSALGKIFSGSQGLAASAAKAAIKSMPQNRKEELLVRLLNENRGKLTEMLVRLAADNGVKVKVEGVKAEQK
jgi:hypothetical protein